MTIEEVKKKDYEAGLYLEVLWYAVFTSPNTSEWTVQDVKDDLGAIFSDEVRNRAEELWNKLQEYSK